MSWDEASVWLSRPTWLDPTYVSDGSSPPPMLASGLLHWLFPLAQCCSLRAAGLVSLLPWESVSHLGGPMNSCCGHVPAPGP